MNLRTAAVALIFAGLPATAQFVQQGNKLVGTGNSGNLRPQQGKFVAVSQDGNTAVVGVGNTDTGVSQVWVHTRSNGVWSQQGGRLAVTGVGGGNDRSTVSMSADGNTFLVGAINDGAGAAYVFLRNGGQSTQSARLGGTGLVGSAKASFSVALSGDGGTAVLGAPSDSTLTGAVLVFIRNGNGTWSQQGLKLVGTGAATPARQGWSVGISADGNTLIAGCNASNDSASGAWIFTRSNGVWTQQARLVGTGAFGAAGQGISVALSADGNTAAIGGPNDTFNEGAVWIFTRSGATWSQQGDKLVGTHPAGDRSLGTSVSLAGDGNTLVAGGPGKAPSIGATWVFSRSNGTWSQLGNELLGTGTVLNDVEQGSAVAVSADGGTVLTGGPLDSDGLGAVWVFARPVAPSGGPAPVSLSPAAASGSGQALTFTYNAPGGFQTLDVVNVLINTALDGRQACYLAYSRPSNSLSIVEDSGDAAKLTGKVMDGTGTVGNSQCTVTLSGSSANGNGNSLTLVLNLSFAGSFAGNKVVYAAARNLSLNNSGWQTMGVYGVSPIPATFPNATGVSPASGNSLSTSLTFTYQAADTAANLQTVWALINTAIDGRGACYVAYYKPGNQLYLYPDNGDGSQAANIVLAGSNSLTNSQCTVSSQGASVQTNGGSLIVTLPVTFKTGFAGFKGIWLAAQTLGAAQTSAWQALGAWAVPAQ